MWEAVGDTTNAARGGDFGGLGRLASGVQDRRPDVTQTSLIRTPDRWQTESAANRREDHGSTYRRNIAIIGPGHGTWDGHRIGG
jgi:hypothetical protein